MTTPAQRTPRTWQWAVKLKDGYYTHPAWAKTTARAWAMSFQDNYAHEDCATAVKVEVRELPAARQRRGKA